VTVARMTTIAEVKQLVQAVMRLPADTELCSVDAYRAMQPVYAKFGRLLAIIRNNIPEDQADDLRRFWKAKGSPPRKQVGTGAYDTPDETWEAMRAASLAGESLRSISKRFGVLYTAVLRRRCAGPTRASLGARRGHSRPRT